MGLAARKGRRWVSQELYPSYEAVEVGGPGNETAAHQLQSGCLGIPETRPRNEQRSHHKSAAGFCSKRDEKRRWRYATRRSSFTSTSLQEVQDITTKGGRPSGRGTVRTSFIMPPQEGQRRIARLSAKTMVANPKIERASV